MLKTFELKNWNEKINEAQQQTAIAHLENDHILFFPQLLFALLQDEWSLLTTEFSDQKAKNISYDCKNNALRGIVCDEKTHDKMRNMMRRFHENALRLISDLFPSYVPHLEMGRTSYRPVEIAGRVAKSYKKDDTRLHVDAFPSSPVQGKRILRVFSNVNPHEKARLWQVGEPFEKVTQYFLPKIKPPRVNNKLLKLFKITKSLRTRYDHLMLQLHDRMKADQQYQSSVTKTDIAFPAGSSWIVQTDSVSHAALAGQYVLEQTFYLPASAMQNEHLSPLRKLEKMCQRKLI